MHDYSIDRHPKGKIVFGLAFLAILITPKLNSFVQDIGLSTGLYSISATTLSVFLLFSFLYWIFNKYLWRVKFLRKVLLVPDINGKWLIEGQTILKKGDQAVKDWSGTVTITQSWSKILIHLQTSQSLSKSVSASIYHDEGIGYRVLYQYENVPDANELELAKHSGSVEMNFDLKCLTAQGHYFTDQHRNTVGTIKLRKITNGN